MSRIDDLIAELAPKGVEFVKLKDLASLQRGKRLVRNQLLSSGEIPVYQNSMTPLGYYREANVGAGSTFIIAAGAAGEIGHSDVDFWAADDVYFYPKINDIDQKYLYYVLQSKSSLVKSRVRRASIPRLPKNAIEDIRIPVPPLEVQREIVRVLDQFTQLEAELEAELEARRRQYEHYFSRLLSFAPGEAEEFTLGDIGRVAMCKRIFKNETSDTGEIPFFKIGTFGGEPDAYISRELFDRYREKYSFPKPGDVLISAAGTIGRTVVYNGEAAYFQDSNIVWLDHDESIVSNAYLKHWYRVVPWTTDGGTIKRLYNANLLRAKILVPPHPVQARIVETLDKFDALVNDLAVGLPAELAARRKQYEYYRDELLTFEEAVA